jgi:hypothetical protein
MRELATEVGVGEVEAQNIGPTGMGWAWFDRQFLVA